MMIFGGLLEMLSPQANGEKDLGGAWEELTVK